MTRETPTEWLAGLTPGQPVAIYSGGAAEAYRLTVRRVTRTTKTQVVVDGVRFWRETGTPYGGGRDQLLPLDHPDAVRAWRVQVFARADYACYHLFRNDERLPMAEVLRKVREAIETAQTALDARRVPEPAPVDAGPHDDAPRKES